MRQSAPVLANLRNLAVAEIRAATDGLTGLPDAINHVWPDAIVQTCVVHLIRTSMRYVAYGDRKKIAAALKPASRSRRARCVVV